MTELLSFGKTTDLYENSNQITRLFSPPPPSQKKTSIRWEWAIVSSNSLNSLVNGYVKSSSLASKPLQTLIHWKQTNARSNSPRICCRHFLFVRNNPLSNYFPVQGIYIEGSREQIQEWGQVETFYPWHMLPRVWKAMMMMIISTETVHSKQLFFKTTSV